MTSIYAVDTGLTPLTTSAGVPIPGSSVWVTVRPDVRRGAAVAADLLVALGKDLTWHGKGRNENEDIQVARAWITALQVSGLVVANAQESPLATLDTLREIARLCNIDLWLLHRAPIDDRTHRKVAKMADSFATIDDIPAAKVRPPREPRTTDVTTLVPETDFPLFRTAMLVDIARYAPGLAAYDDELDRSGPALTSCAAAKGQVSSAVVRVLRAAPDDGELIARLRALQVLAWRNDFFLQVDTTTLLASVERPCCAGNALDEVLLSYRQPQRAIVTALTLRGLPLDAIDSLTLADARANGMLRGVEMPNATDDLHMAVKAQRHLRELQGANPDDRLLPPDAKTLARFVNDAAADLGINIAGRRVERALDQTTWLKRLGITIKAM